VDATDGVLARMARVKEVTPSFDGARLDDIVDYLTFTFLPILLLYHAGDLPADWGWIPVAAVLLSSAYGFSPTDAKTSDNYFTGFPSYWNIARCTCTPPACILR
jgi:phosphatidylcholine synthase